MTKYALYLEYVQNRKDDGHDDGELSFDAWFLENYHELPPAKKAAKHVGLTLEGDLLFFNGKEIGAVYECDDSTKDDPTYRRQFLDSGNAHQGFSTKEAAGEALMNDGVAWLWQLNGDLSADSVVEALRLVLPMAKAYAAQNAVGGNQESVNWATMILEDADEVLSNEKKDFSQTDSADELPW